MWIYVRFKIISYKVGWNTCWMSTYPPFLSTSSLCYQLLLPFSLVLLHAFIMWCCIIFTSIKKFEYHLLFIMSVHLLIRDSELSDWFLLNLVLRSYYLKGKTYLWAYLAEYLLERKMSWINVIQMYKRHML